MIESNKINFDYRKTNLPNNLIITNLILQVIKGSKEKIKNKINKFKKDKNNAQPSKINTGGSTF